MLFLLTLSYKLKNNEGNNENQHPDLMTSKLCVEPSHTISLPSHISLYWLAGMATRFVTIPVLQVAPPVYFGLAPKDITDSLTDSSLNLVTPRLACKQGNNACHLG